MSTLNPKVNFSEWQRDLVLIAKNSCIWLTQLSNKYHKIIKHLDEIPDEEFKWLQSLGVTGLWLIGIWKRSPASKRIKELYGRDHLVASAYSILSYEISEKLGGDKALNKLEKQAMEYGIRLACDMVPNHTGIDSDWVSKRPEWYISTKEKPFDGWSFKSPNLSRDPESEIRIEDGYYAQVGAAETFQVSFPKTGKKFFIYHGNDGTSMPWNDTAQLNYLRSDVRNAVKKIIRDVAGKFKIIRLDAAMTLIREHFKRLWFPDTEGISCIPTRQQNTMTQEEFDQKMPQEFWSEVIQELKSSAPDTLLMAEAFWLMEKYFIQDLGMHRVYNSAFMHQLRDEENEDFFGYMKDILQTDPTILERFVNYVTTPDEMSAADQFGKSEKYFGIFGLMASLPGLPMLGHGQIEGYFEKYGMDFDKPMLDEKPDIAFIEKHEFLISPLLKSRKFFSSVENLRLFNFHEKKGSPNQNVFIFSNRFGDFRTLIAYNNQNKAVKGNIRESITQILNLHTGESGKESIRDALAIPNNKSEIHLTEIRTKSELHFRQIDLKDGIHIKLQPYELCVYSVEMIS